jgi:prepilin-type processing-associated H-X9-DG protein
MSASTSGAPNFGDWWYDSDVLVGAAERSDQTFGSLSYASGCATAVPPLYLPKFDKPGPPAPNAQGSPGSACDHFRFWSCHPGGSQFAFVDGTVKMIQYQSRTEGRLLIRAIATRNGGPAETAADWTIIP